MTSIRSGIQNLIMTSAVLHRGRITKVRTASGTFLATKYMGKDIYFRYTPWAAYPLNEIFVKEDYRRLGVKGRVVVDIGASIGDSAIYFALRGARKVYGYEPNKERYEMAIQNIKANGLEKKITMKCGTYGGRPKAAGKFVAKVDCEGCEYGLLERLVGFKQIIMEYHRGHESLRDTLKKNGYSVSINPEKRHSGQGVLFAKK